MGKVGFEKKDSIAPRGGIKIIRNIQKEILGLTKGEKRRRTKELKIKLH